MRRIIIAIIVAVFVLVGTAAPTLASGPGHVFFGPDSLPCELTAGAISCIGLSQEDTVVTIFLPFLP